jgi:hypothetical protein
MATSANVGFVPEAELAFFSWLKNMPDVRLRRSHPGTEQPIVRFSEASANFPAHVHLDQGELLKILCVDLIKIDC